MNERLCGAKERMKLRGETGGEVNMQRKRGANEKDVGKFVRGRRRERGREQNESRGREGGRLLLESIDGQLKSQGEIGAVFGARG